MNQKVRRAIERVDSADRFLQRRGDVFVRFFVEANMAIADLNEAEFAGSPFRRWAIWPKAFELSTPPLAVQIAPVPAHAMHSKNPRRSTPSLLQSAFIRLDNAVLLSAAVRDEYLFACRDIPHALRDG